MKAYLRLNMGPEISSLFTLGTCGLFTLFRMIKFWHQAGADAGFYNNVMNGA